MHNDQTLIHNNHQGSRYQKQEQPLPENILSMRPWEPVDKSMCVERWSNLQMATMRFQVKKRTNIPSRSSFPPSLNCFVWSSKVCCTIREPSTSRYETNCGSGPICCVAYVVVRRKRYAHSFDVLSNEDDQIFLSYMVYCAVTVHHNRASLWYSLSCVITVKASKTLSTASLKPCREIKRILKKIRKLCKQRVPYECGRTLGSQGNTTFLCPSMRSK